MANKPGKVKVNKDFYKRIENSLFEGAKKVAKEVQEELQREAPWTDRTGEARKSLFAEAEETDGVVTISMGYGVEYGEYLERSHFGKFAVINPYFDREKKELARRIVDASRD